MTNLCVTLCDIINSHKKAVNVYPVSYLARHSLCYWACCYGFHFFTILFSILPGIMLGLLLTIMFAITIRWIFLNIGPVIGEETHTAAMRCCFASHSDLSEHLQKKLDSLHKLAMMLLALLTSCRHCWGYPCPFLQRIYPHPYWKILQIFLYRKRNLESTTTQLHIPIF